MHHKNFQIYNANVPGDLATQPINMENRLAFSITATLSGGQTPSGSIKIQGSNDPGENGQAITNWFDVTQPVTSVSAVSGDGTVTWNYANIGYKWLRVVYTRTGGSANFNIRCTAKGF